MIHPYYGILCNSSNEWDLHMTTLKSLWHIEYTANGKYTFRMI